MFRASSSKLMVLSTFGSPRISDNMETDDSFKVLRMNYVDLKLDDERGIRASGHQLLRKRFAINKF